MIVPDASATGLLLGDPAVDARVDRATRLLSDDPEWVVPEMWRTEVLNVVRGLALGGKLSGPAAEFAVSWLRDITVVTAPTRPLLSRMWELRANLSAYDASYVAAAESYGLTLVTADARIAKAGVARCPVLVIS